MDCRRWILVLGLGLCASCAQTRHLRAPNHLEPFRIDALASEVQVENSMDAEEIFDWCSASIEEMFPGDEASGRPARFQAKVRIDHSPYAGTIVLWALTFPYELMMLGGPLPFGEVMAEVELTLEVDGRQLHGRGAGRNTSFFFLGGGGNSFLEAAVRNATQAAVVDAARELPR